MSYKHLRCVCWLRNLKLASSHVCRGGYFSFVCCNRRWWLLSEFQCPFHSIGFRKPAAPCCVKFHYLVYSLNIKDAEWRDMKYRHKMNKRGRNRVPAARPASGRLASQHPRSLAVSPGRIPHFLYCGLVALAVIVLLLRCKKVRSAANWAGKWSTDSNNITLPFSSSFYGSLRRYRSGFLGEY